MPPVSDIFPTSISITDEQSSAFVSLGVHVRYIRVPVIWRSVRPNWPYTTAFPTTFGEWEPVLPCAWEPTIPPSDNCNWAYTLVPGAVGYGAASVVLDPFKLRTEFFRLDITDTDQVLAFLCRAGLWELRGISGERNPHLVFSHVTNVAAGFRRLEGISIATSAAELFNTQRYWREQLDMLRTNPGAIMKRFAPAQNFGDALQAEDVNSLPLHIEWRHGKPQGVIDPVSIQELLRVTFHLDVLAGVAPQVCERPDCRVRFTGRKRQFCSDDCARVMATRAWRLRSRTKVSRKRKGRKNSNGKP